MTSTNQTETEQFEQLFDEQQRQLMVEAAEELLRVKVAALKTINQMGAQHCRTGAGSVPAGKLQGFKPHDFGIPQLNRLICRLNTLNGCSDVCKRCQTPLNEKSYCQQAECFYAHWPQWMEWQEPGQRHPEKLEAWYGVRRYAGYS